jgi:hypothetical protein
MKPCGCYCFDWPAVLVIAPAIVSGQSGRRVAPNFEGIWNSATTTLLERPAQLKDKPFFTKEEAAAWDREFARRNEEPPPGTRQTGTGTYNTVYREFGTRSSRRFARRSLPTLLMAAFPRSHRLRPKSGGNGSKA